MQLKELAKKNRKKKEKEESKEEQTECVRESKIIREGRKTSGTQEMLLAKINYEQA